ncbi:MAG: hypothetical protein HND46_13280 [Chloroflexi bacterium]|nr:hypothetical protein [Chloroflexota bacterium]NOG64384.1 hypothetical protein [Chloroflexota bacterium]
MISYSKQNILGDVIKKYQRHGWRLVEQTETTAILNGVPTNEVFMLLTTFLMIFGIFGGIVNIILVWFFTKEIEAKIQTLANGAIQISVQQIILTDANDKFIPRAVSPSKKLLMYAYLGLSLIPTLIYLRLFTSQ